MRPPGGNWLGGSQNDASAGLPLRSLQTLLAVIFLAVAWLVGNSGAGHQLDNNIADSLVRWFSASSVSPSISTLLAIDEDTLNRHGGLRALRPLLADTLDLLAANPPAVLAVDLTLADNGDPSEDRRLASALRKLPSVILAAEIRSSGGHWELPAAPFAEAVASLGHVHAAPDPLDAVCREIPLEKAVDKKRFWALSLEAYRLWQREPYVLETPGSLVVGSVDIPVSRDDSRLMRIRFQPPGDASTSTVRQISVADLLAHPERARSLAGSVLFLGITAQSAARDRLMTPFSFGRTMQGVEIHANAFETLASRRFLTVQGPATSWALSLLLAAAVLLSFTLLTGWPSYAAAALPVLFSLLLPAIAYLQDVLVPSTMLILSAWLPFLALATHRYWFVNRRLRRAERETENYRDAIHYVTHEMRTPLSAIQGSSEIISRYQLTQEKQKQIAGMIHSESKRLGRLIQVFLDVERLSAGQMELRTDEFPASALVETCMERAKPLAQGKEITLRLESGDAESRLLTGDLELLEHALYNLLTNAIKYSPAASTVALACRVEGADLHLRVVDQGIGMAPDEVKAVFRKFYRTKAAEQSGEKGSGIGLSIVEQIVSAHSGRIEVESEPGRGSVFTLILPSRQASAPEPVPSPVPIRD